MLLRLFGSLIVSPTPSPTFRRLLAQTPPESWENSGKGRALCHDDAMRAATSRGWVAQGPINGSQGRPGRPAATLARGVRSGRGQKTASGHLWPGAGHVGFLPSSALTGARSAMMICASWATAMTREELDAAAEPTPNPKPRRQPKPTSGRGRFRCNTQRRCKAITRQICRVDLRRAARNLCGVLSPVPNRRRERAARTRPAEMQCASHLCSWGASKTKGKP